MKAKKVAAFLFALVMVLSVIGCAGQQTAPPAVGPTSTPAQEQPPEEVPDEEVEVYEELPQYPHERYGEKEFSDENVHLEFYFDRAEYTHSDVVNIRATVTNVGDETVVFVKGSGSNVVPDALRVTLGDMTALFRPAIATQDMQHQLLEPGEYAVFELPFAPYMPAAEQALPPLVGFVESLEFFQNEDWVHLPAGDIEGEISFSYVTRAGEEDLIITDEDEVFVVEGRFTVRLVEA